MALAAAGAAALAPASPAWASQRFASPTSTDVTGLCLALTPCRLDHAVNGAAAGDEVIVESGTYSVDYTVAPTVPVNVHGVAGLPRPRLIGGESLSAPVVNLTAGGSLSHLYIEGHKSVPPAVELTGAVGSGLEIYGAEGSGVGAELNGVSGGTVLRDSVVRSTGGSAIQAKDGASAGPVKVLNVTAIATGDGTTGAKGKQSAATTTVRNTIARGKAKDIDTTGARLAVDHSNFRPAYSSGYTDGGSNQSAEPTFVDRANGNLRPVEGSVTIDAGTASDADLGALDPDGLLRNLGAAPDMGAYEYPSLPPPSPSGDGSGDALDGGDGTPTGGTGDDFDADPDLREDALTLLTPPAPPVFGSTVGVGPVSGSVRVRPAGSREFVDLPAGASLPVNSTIDATSGVVELTSARDSRGRSQTGRFWGGVFRVEQRRSGAGYTDLVLGGGEFRGCPRRAGRARRPGTPRPAPGAGTPRPGPGAGTPRRARATRRARRAPAVRRLWGRDRRGRFRTRGRNGHAVVRGTTWLTEDRCDGTLFAVREGAIEVRAKGRRERVLLRAGGRYLARALAGGR